MATVLYRPGLSSDTASIIIEAAISNAEQKPLVDACGVAHTPSQGRARIVSLVPSITELLFDLGLGASVVGCTSFCVHPRDSLTTVPRIGGRKTPRIHKIRALRPTHAIVNVDENTRADFDQLRAFVPNVVVTHPLAPADNPALFRLLGGIFGREDDAARLCARFGAALQTLSAEAAPFAERRVLYLIWRNPWMTVSRETYISRMLALVNWTTIGHDPRVRYPVVDPCQIVDGATDIVLFSSEPFPFKPKHIDEFRRLTACKPTICRPIDGEMTSWYGSRAVEGLAYLQRLRVCVDGELGA